MGVKRSRQSSVSSSEDPRSPYSREQSADVKIVHLDAGSAVSDKPAIMKCSLPPHAPLTFSSFEEYDVHYQKTHMNRCSECQRNLPDDHFLILHIAENHDPIRAAKQERGEKTYACLVSTCDRLCSTPQKRRLHCIDKHQFPRNYDFFIVNDGIDRRSSMLRPPHRRRSSTMNSAVSEAGAHRRRSSTINSIAAGKGPSAAEDMDVVKSPTTEHHEEEDEEDGDEDEETRLKHAPLKLRGRGGFGRPRGAGRGRVRGHDRGHASSATQPPAPAPSTKATPAASNDPMERLTSGLSALQFVPHSLYAARGRGRGRGGA